jgi:ribonucleoside-diphosphate reductase alpha chain
MTKNDTTFGPLAQTILRERYAQRQGETWPQIAHRVATHVMGAVRASPEMIREVEELIVSRKFIPGGRYLAMAGRQLAPVNNCFLLRAEDSREGWATLLRCVALCLMFGGGVGVDYSAIRADGKPIRRTGGVATGPLALMQMVNEVGRGIRSGGNRRSALFGSLSWRHDDAQRFITLKDWSPEVRALKEANFSFPATLDGTNISVQLDDEFFRALQNDNHAKHAWARQVYMGVIRQMCKKSEPGFQIDVGVNKRETLRNACCELVSEDTNDCCNLGSINVARIESIEEMRLAVDLATAFLLAGTVYSAVPYPEVDHVRTKNRRLGLGLMGIHEWLLRHGKRYGPDEDLAKLLEAYATSTEVAAKWADEWELSHPVKTRAVAPNGTISLIAETTSGIEPLFCVAYKRRYLHGNTWKFQYVVDPTAQRLIADGAAPDSIEDAYSLASDVERRVAFQAWLQQYVDHAISSTINLPAWGTPQNNEDTTRAFGEMLLPYLPKLRGLTVYADGSRGGQPITTVSYATAMKHIGEVFTEQGDVCSLSRGGVCGE